VDRLSNRIAEQIYNNSKNLEASYHAGNSPLFDTTACEACQYHQKIGSPYSNNEKVWRCLDQDCWNKKQGQAEETRANELAAQTKNDKPGTESKILTSKDVDFNEHEALNERTLKELDTPEECASCPKTALYKYNLEGSDAPHRICLNPSCFRAKKSKKTRDIHAREKKQDQALTVKLCESFRGNLNVRNCLLVMAGNLLSGLNNADGKADILAYFPTLPTTKGKLDIEATKKALYDLKSENLVQICAAAIITSQRRSFSGEISPQLTGKVKQDTQS